MSDERGTPAPDTGMLFYQTEDGQSRIQVRLQDGTAWLSQRLLSELYQVSTRTISEHTINIYSDHELSPEATIRKFRLVQTEGSRQVERLADFYNLDMILAVGYRVRSHRGVQFNQRAILEHSGHISMEEAKRLALEQYQIFSQKRIETEDAVAEKEFEQEVKKLLPPDRKEKD